MRKAYRLTKMRQNWLFPYKAWHFFMLVNDMPVPVSLLKEMRDCDDIEIVHHVVDNRKYIYTENLDIQQFFEQGALKHV